MPDRIRQAVAIQKDLFEGGRTEKGLHSLIAKFAHANLYNKPAQTTELLKKQVIAALAKKYLPLARETGIKSAKPILDGLGLDAVPIHGGVARSLAKQSQQTQDLFLLKLQREIDWQKSEIQQAFLEARHNSIARKQLIRDLVKADKDSLASIKNALERKDAAAEELANAERLLAKQPKSKRLLEKQKEARNEMKLAKASLSRRATFLARFERAVQGHIRDSIRRESYDAQTAAFRAAGYDSNDEYMWVAVNGSDACPSCRDHHGEVKTLDKWGGTDPGSGNTYCGASCMCQLVPLTYAANNPGLSQPIQY